jgi:hypothetical protein
MLHPKEAWRPFSGETLEMPLLYTLKSEAAATWSFFET